MTPDTSSWQVGSDFLEEPSTVLQSGEPLPALCDGEIDWTLFSFSHGFRQPRAVVLAAAAAASAAVSSDADSTVTGALSA